GAGRRPAWRVEPPPVRRPLPRTALGVSSAPEPASPATAPLDEAGLMRPGRTFTALLPCLVLGAAAAAQVPDSQPTPAVTPEAESRDTAARAPAQPAGPQALEDQGARWRTSWFPYLTGGANDSPVLTFRVRHWQPAEYEDRTTYTAAFNGDAGIAPKGSRFVAASFKAPGLWDGWRL